MKHNKKITYTTGEFAAHFGISKDTLIYYDKIKLFCPEDLLPNGYRCYSSSQIAAFWTLLSLRELHVPIKTLLNYFQDPSPEKLSELSSKKLQQVEEEIKRLKNIRTLLGQITNSTEEAKKATFGVVQIKKLPARRLLLSKPNDGNLETSEQQWAENCDRFLLEAGLTRSINVGSIIAETDWQNGDFDRIHRLFANSNSSAGTIRKGGTYAVYYYKGAYDGIKYAYIDFLAQVKKLGYTLSGDAYEEYLVEEAATKNENEYVTKLMIRIRGNTHL